MKKVFITIITALLMYSFLRELDLTKTLTALAGLGTIYIMYRLPMRILENMKYPLIILSLLVTASFFVYPKVPSVYALRVAIIFLSFYSLIFYTINMEEKPREFFKEITALSILFFSSCFNLFMAGALLLVLSFALALILILFVLERTRMLPFIAGYTLVAGILVWQHGDNILGGGLTGLGDIQKYVLLASSFTLLIVSFVFFVKKKSIVKILPFFGFLYITVDVLMVLGLKLATGLLYQPVLFFALVSPLVAVMLKAEGEKA